MKHDKNIQIIDELTDISEIIEIPFNHNREPLKSFGVGSSNISFIGYDKVLKFQNGLEHLFFHNKDISDTFTLKRFENELVVLIRYLRDKKIKCSTSDIDKLYNELLKIEIKESEILYEIYGVELSIPSIQLGRFTIYNYDLSIDSLIKRFPNLGAFNDIYFGHRKSNHFIGIPVKARENDKATEIANNLCQTFENVISFMIGDLKHENTIGIFNYRGWQHTTAIVCNNDSMGFNLKNKLAFPVNVQDNYFVDKLQGHDLIWDLITKDNKTEIEKRLLNSIEWIGKAIHDIDLSKSLVQFVFAIEGMLQHNEKAFITPSIVSQLSDWLAFIIHDDKEQRKKIAKYFKDIYKKRSSIAHGAINTIDNEDLYMAFQISKLMIKSFLTVKQFRDIKTMEELNVYLNDLKFK